MAKAPAGTVEYTKVSPDELHFDPSNPRFTRPGGRPSEAQIQTLLEKEPHIALELVDSFLANGFIEYEPLVVRRRDEGGYLVIEGNRRLAAIRHIRANRAKYEKKSARLADLDNVSVLIFPDTGDEQDQKQRVYLGVRHLFGFRDWPAESKARFLDSQIKSKADLVRTMRELNIKRHEIARYLVPLRLRKQARELWEPHKDQEFWVLGEGLNRSGIREYIGLEVEKDSLQIKGVANDRLKNLLTFVYGTPQEDRKDRRIEDTRDLSKLGKVLVHKEARAALEKGRTLEEASILIDSPDEAITRLKRLASELKVVVDVLKKRPGGSSLAAKFTTFERAVKQFISDAK